MIVEHGFVFNDFVEHEPMFNVLSFLSVGKQLWGNRLNSKLNKFVASLTLKYGFKQGRREDLT